MPIFRPLAAACLLVVAVPRAADAEWHLTPMAGLTFATDTSIAHVGGGAEAKHPMLGGSVSFLGSGVLGAETVVAWVPGFFQKEGTVGIESSRSLAWMGNLVLTLPQRWTEYSLRPFVSGGFGLLHASLTEELDVFPVDLNLKGYNIGGGAIGFLTPRTGLRFDVRYYSTIRPTDEGPIAVSPGGDNRVHLRYMTASIGVVFRR